MGNIRFKVGDRVRIKSLDWYNENKDNYGAVYAGNGFVFWNYMAGLCGEIMTISSIKVDPEDSNKGYYFMENSEEKWTDGMIEGLVEEPVLSAPNITEGIFIHEKDMKWTTEYLLPDGYIFKDENGNVINATKIVLEKKKKEYPKTYEECCKILGFLNVDLCFNADYRSFDASKEQWKKLGLMNQFYQLLVCRDAYWKIAGDEMGLGKPWEPDWNGKLYYLYYNPTNTTGVVRGFTSDGVLAYVVLAFPTEEMRDAFYENFKELIEQCKELL